MRDRSTLNASLELERARNIAANFSLSDPLAVSEFSNKGNINQQTYAISSGRAKDRKEFLLQLLNPSVFTNPEAVMHSMIACIQTQNDALAKGAIDAGEWETIRLIPTRDGKDYFAATHGDGKECWRMMTRIDEIVTFRSLREISNLDLRLHIAEQAGRGLALFGALTAEMDGSHVVSPLPGYRNTELYFNQLLSVLAGCRTPQECAPYLPSDPIIRESAQLHFMIRLDSEEYRRRAEDPDLRRYINLALEQKSFGLSLMRKMETGELKKVVVHGDTKLDNFLFSAQTCQVRALVDLDTIMPHTWLSDWGDMARSLVNISGERERDLSNIDVDLDIFAALAKGYLHTNRCPDSRELDLMSDAPQIMALELGVRFLADYLRGDSYFQLRPEDPPDLNKTRAMVQFRLFERLQNKSLTVKQIIESFAA
jgi:hypothetical protein